MAVAKTPRSKWIEAGLEALSNGGPESVRIEGLAQSLGVSKGGFYGYFADRQQLMVEMLDTWEHEVTDQVIERVDTGATGARERLRLLMRIASGPGGVTDIKTDLAIREWARRDDDVAQRLSRVDDRRNNYLRALFGQFVADEDEIEVRCFLVFSVWIAGHFLAENHPTGQRHDVLRLAMQKLLD